MIYALLTSLPWAAVVYVLVRSHAADRDMRHEALMYEREGWRQTERELLNRIQAPESAAKVAEMELQQPDLENPPYVGWDDDDAFHEAKGVTSGAA